jgi:hypothetical protein
MKTRVPRARRAIALGVRHATLRLCQWLLGLLLAAAVTLGRPSAALGWTDSRPRDAETEYLVNADGTAIVTQRVRWVVVAGRLHEFDLNDLPTDLSLIEATATTTTGVPVPITVRGPTPGRLTVALGDPGVGLSRGSVEVVLRYGTSLRALGAVRRANGDAVIELRACPWERGMEASEIRVSLPSGSRRARWVAEQPDGVDATVSTELARDVLRAMRRHVPSGVAWTVRVAADPALFPWLSAGVPRRASRPAPRAPRSPLALIYGLGLAAVLLIGSQALRRLEGPARVTLPRALRPLPVALALAAAAAHALAIAGLPGCVSPGTALLLGAVALSLPAPARGAAARRRSLAARAAQVGALLLSGAGFVASARAAWTTGVVLSLDAATLLVASLAVSLLRASRGARRPRVTVRPTATRSFGVGEALFSDGTAVADETSGSRCRPASPPPAPRPA